ncbi:glycogen debranching protein GlgX [Kaarinaea lacus]
MAYSISTGSRFPPGSLADDDGVNFSVFSRHATAVELLLYEAHDSAAPFQVIALDPDEHRTYFTWHVYVHDLPVGTHYTWRAAGPDDTAYSGYRFNANKELTDPWARAVTTSVWHRGKACDPFDNSHHSIRAVVLAPDNYDWEGDQPLNHALEDSIIYELHVGGFTRHASAGAQHPGTFSALIEKIPYLQSLGITDVELMPIMAFDEQDLPLAGAAMGLKNYWGYSTHSFWSPHPGYCVAPELGAHANEFRDLVKALHRAGIGVILDVVFNHTAESGADGPTINFKGLGNPTFYHLEPEDRRQYRDYTGCGNTVNCNHPIVADFIHDCLEYWVKELHVDGFRFDLASVFSRGEDGVPLHNAPIVWSIELSNVLTHTRIIAEAWDASGLYQVGAFPGMRWAEWNGRYRDVMRRFVRGDAGLVNEVATRMAGSSDLYQPNGQLPINSINFITCHDGYTLYDLVSYNQKHNYANGEDNRDGHNDSLSWNCGVEGPTNDEQVLALRLRQVKNFFAAILLSQGVPMLLAGDEVLRSQRGNNNAYCQDNEISWFDWNLLEQNTDMLRFVTQMIALRKRHSSLRRRRFLTGEPAAENYVADIDWHGTQLKQPPWNDGSAQYIAFTLAGAHAEEEHLHIILNMADEELSMELPQFSGRVWHRAVDTSLTSPNDINTTQHQARVEASHYAVNARSVVVLEAR